MADQDSLAAIPELYEKHAQAHASALDRPLAPLDDAGGAVERFYHYIRHFWAEKRLEAVIQSPAVLDYHESLPEGAAAAVGTTWSLSITFKIVRVRVLSVEC